jgi:Ti type entry exclusion protein TrbK
VNIRSLAGLVIALLLSLFLGSAIVWALTYVRVSANDTVPSPGGMQGYDADHDGRAATFFGGDPERNVRGGQEMKTRW